MIEALALLAAGALAKYKASHDAARRQEKFRQQMEGYQRVKAKEIESAANDYVNTQRPDARAAENQKIITDNTQSLKDTVGAATALSTATPAAGKVSDTYKDTSESYGAKIDARTKRAIEQLAIMGAPGERQVKTGIRFGRAAGVTDAAGQASANVGRGYMQDIGGVSPNPWLTIGGDAAMTAGGFMLGAGAGGGGAVNPDALAMGADAGGNFAFEDSAGNLQRSFNPYRNRIPSYYWSAGR